MTTETEPGYTDADLWLPEHAVWDMRYRIKAIAGRRIIHAMRLTLAGERAKAALAAKIAPGASTPLIDQ